MVKTLLLDLDGTLLDNDMGTFLPAYIRLLSERFADIATPPDLAGCLMAGTQAMIRNADPSATLRETFGQVFFPALRTTDRVLRPLIDGFYAQDYPRLRPLTRSRPSARRLMEWATGHGVEVAIATNPLFPRTAIEQRLDWAGVPPNEFGYALVASYETFHFAKPHPEFVAEILARLNRRPSDVLFVGDDWANDIQPAAALGAHVAWVRPAATATATDGLPLAAAGTLDELVGWLEAGALDSLRAGPTPPSALPAILAGDLAAMLNLLSQASADAWKRRPSADKWSLTEVVCHLRDVEGEVHLPRLRLVADESNPFISGVDSDVWAEERDYRSQDPIRALEDFIAARKTTLEILRGLPPNAWPRPCRHAIFGTTTLTELTALVSDHDRAHLDQVKCTLDAVARP